MCVHVLVQNLRAEKEQLLLFLEAFNVLHDVPYVIGSIIMVPFFWRFAKYVCRVVVVVLFCSDIVCSLLSRVRKTMSPNTCCGRNQLPALVVQHSKHELNEQRAETQAQTESKRSEVKQENKENKEIVESKELKDSTENKENKTESKESKEVLVVNEQKESDREEKEEEDSEMRSQEELEQELIDLEQERLDALAQIRRDLVWSEWKELFIDLPFVIAGLLIFVGPLVLLWALVTNQITSSSSHWPRARVCLVFCFHCLLLAVLFVVYVLVF